ncbi:MAG: histidinol-phosphatase [Desulfobacterales bacterium]|nr:histidinol-phosphatase [Desulfobacterales bacterium]
MPSNPINSASAAWDRVSIHGGHSGQFCLHAKDSLEAVVRAYIAQGFSWVGITEHLPPPSDRFRYEDEISAGLSAAFLQDRFSRYIEEARRLQETCRRQIRIYVGMETETYTGAVHFCRELIREHRPEYIVGSVHHVDDVNFDFSAEHYQAAVSAAGGLDNLYLRYFDQQYDMIRSLSPAVVGHFDLVRIHDPDYRKRMEAAPVKERIRRNLELIRERNLILDCNARAFVKGAAEPYPTETILRQALELNIAVVPGDDSHGIDSVGLHVDRVCRWLADLGFDTAWKLPIS